MFLRVLEWMAQGFLAGCVAAVLLLDLPPAGADRVPYVIALLCFGLFGAGMRAGVEGLYAYTSRA